jgi:hypothetical protein
MRPLLEVAFLSGTAVFGAVAATWILRRPRRDPAKREQKRCANISARGRLIDGIASEFADGVVYYSYSWRGVEYEAAQDLRIAPIVLPESSDLLLGAVTVKFLPADPCNSIVLSATWSGFPRLRLASPPEYQAEK